MSTPTPSAAALRAADLLVHPALPPSIRPKIVEDTARIIDAQFSAYAATAKDAEKNGARLAWLHTGGDRDAEGYEWGIYRVKWSQHGQPVDVRATLSDFSDLDAAMSATGAR